MSSLARRFAHIDLWWVAALLGTLGTVVALYTDPGLLNTRAGGDSPFLLFRLYELAASLRAGVFPVRWMPDAAYGYGFPFFNFYAALPFYFAACLHLVGLSLVAALKATHALGAVLAAAGMYAWMRTLFESRPAACLAALAYAYAPFHLVNVYVRGDSLCEYYAFAWYPLILLCLERVIRAPSTRRMAALALAYGALLMTHNVSALIFTPFVALYALARLSALRAGRGAWLAASAGGVLGIALAAWVWLPALTEGQLVQLEVQTTGYFNYAGHFRSADLIQSTLLFNYDATSGPTPFAMGVLQALFIVLGALPTSVRFLLRQQSAARAVPLIGVALATLMITPASAWLYAHVPLLAFVQFPWRFLSVQALFGAALIGLLALEVPPRVARLAVPFCALALALPQLLTLPHTFLAVRDADVTPARLQAYEWFSGNIGTTIRAEYLPHTVVPRPYTSAPLVYDAPDAARITAGTADATRTWASADAQDWHITTGPQGATVALPLYAFPGWSATLDGVPGWAAPFDGVPTPTSALDGLGWLTLTIPPGPHAVALKFGPTPVRLAADRLAALAALVIAALTLAPGLLTAFRVAVLMRALVISPPPLNGDNPADGDSRPLNAREPMARASLPRPNAAQFAAFGRAPWGGLLAAFGRAPWGGLLAALAIILLTALLQPALPVAPNDDLTWDFSVAPFLAHGPARFAQAAVTHYTYSADSVAAGTPFSVTLTWQADPAARAPFTSTLTFTPPGREFPDNAVRPCWACVPRTRVEQPTGATWTSTYTFTVPATTMPGLYGLALDAGPAFMADGTPRGRIYLRPLRVTAAEPPPALGPESEAVTQGALALSVALDPLSQPAPDGGAFQRVRMLYRPHALLPAQYAVSLRLYDFHGYEWATYDGTAGAGGFFPSTLWTPGTTVVDDLTLALPAGLPPSDAYRLSVTLYDRRTLAPLDTPLEIPWTWPTATLRPGLTPRAAWQGLGLLALDMPTSVTQGAEIPLGATWSVAHTLRAPLPQFQAVWTLVAADGTRIYTQASALVPGSTTQDWPADAYVLGRYTLTPPPDIAPGTYTLTLTLFVPEQHSAQHELYSAPITLTGHTRSFSVPPLATPFAADFGNVFHLHGYTLARTDDALALTLVWSATRAPGHDYTRFVHLFDPASEAIPAQQDSGPRENTYPTSQWVAGEVVSETLTLNLAAVPPGTYALGVGWYDDSGRLGERLVLPARITR